MKKILVLLTVAMGIFAFSTGAFATGVEDIVTCLTCDKCALGVLPCPGTVVQGGMTPTCSYFDYDYNDGQGIGYASGRPSVGNCRAIFPICNCVDTETTFIAGHTIGIRMTIMVNGASGQKGAYWSQPADANIEFGKYASKTLACNTAGYGSNFGPGNVLEEPIAPALQRHKSTHSPAVRPAMSPLATRPRCWSLTRLRAPLSTRRGRNL